MIRNETIRREGIVYSGQWEPIYFQKQSGHRNARNLDAAYDFKRSEAYVRHLASIGVNQLWGNFFKGYGLDFEDAEQRKVARLIHFCHKHGLRYVAYITFGTLTLETLLPEQPTARDWIARPDVSGRAPYSGYQNFRARVCYSSDEYIDYLLRVVDKALDMGADGIHFDNAEMAIGFEACRCSRCRMKFRAWLDERYGRHTAKTRRAGQLRYGMNDFTHANAPWFTPGQHPVNQRRIEVPHQQDWIQFRCNTFAAAAKRLSDRIRSRGRLVEFNFGKNENTNNPYYRGLDYERVYPLVDISFHEGVSGLGANRHGTPICPIRSYRVAESFGIGLMTYCRSTLAQAMAFAFNRGMTGTAHAGQDASRQRFFDFFRQYRRYNTCAESMANVAVLRHRLSMAYDSYTPVLAACAVEQVMQESHIPYAILAASQLDRLGRFRLLIIPAMQTMTDGEIDTVSRWVRRGGRLMLVGEVASKDDLNQFRTPSRRVETIEDLLASDRRQWGFAPLAGRAFDAMFVTDAGKGRVGFLPRLDHLEVPGTGIPDWTVEDDHINAPANAAEVLGVIRELLDGAERLRVIAPREVVVDLCRHGETGEGIVHLVNIGHAAGRTAGADVAFRWPGTFKSVRCLRYDEKPVRLAVRKRGPWHRVRVEGIREHAVLILPGRTSAGS
ncbi:MAG TPA: alpha-amylase family protein [Phycisphaerae bacterium]|nr:alpha-amylase family protein [Phycisphaerae bacterium]